MKQLLLVVDYQRDFVDGALGFAGAEALDGPIARRIARARDEGWDVAFTLDTHNDNYLDTQEGRKLPVSHCILNSDGWQLYGQTGQALRRETDMVICKPTFPSLWLGNWLKQQGYDAVELCGLVSHICVLSNAVMVKAALPEAEITVDAALTASYDPVLHEKALDVLEGLQINVPGRTDAT
ncbi:cysteine hydrolase [Pseudoflavonifractor phocaeensis]|uniref:cysteine hydrolase family protein n=1 Tax=Pseudoflavonifractor phocaeensis TaxID=1870988 RepID=UPI00195AD7EB|nr:isochorismatase family cysteine hydrolase [Pseudoflavonifractor phocaeensis]MBM6937993.1 cysteine hydrolase [Pseudoflavonifractor phocaeensis]